jgi:putative DNA primase/helicase
MSLVESALIYAAQGWSVFPCNPRTKQPLVKGDLDADGKPIPNTGGVKKASTDAETIRGWWQRWPKAMIGMACGNAAGVFVLDVDAGIDKETGEEFTLDGLMTQLAAELGEPLPDCWAVATPRGGRHFYFRMPERDFGNRKGKLPLRFDVRGEGGYVILPPSKRDDGRAYEWTCSPMPGEDPRAAPQSLIDCINKAGRFAELRQVAAPARSRAPAARPADVSQAEDETVRRYALSAFDAELRELARAVPGTRNEAINKAAFALGQLVGAGTLTEAAVRAGLQDTVADWPDQAKSFGSIESGLRGGRAKPRDLSEIRRNAAERAQRRDAAPGFAPPPANLADYGGETPADADAGEDRDSGARGRGFRRRRKLQRTRDLKTAQAESKESLDLRLAFLPLTDLGNAERFRERNRGKLLWCREMDGNWLHWDGRRWSREGAEARARIAEHECVRAIKDEADALRRSGQDVPVGSTKKKKPKAPSHKEKVGAMFAALAGQDTPADPDGGEEEEQTMYSDLLDRWARKSEDASGLSPIGKHAQPYLSVSSRELDADPFAINVLNGTLHAGWNEDGVAEIIFKKHDPDDLITKLAPVVYDKKATCPNYDRFLEQVQPNEDNRRFLHQWGGYALTGDVSEQRLVFFWGKGRNGKSTLVDAWGLCVGEYGTASPIETFLAEGRGRQGNAASPDLAMLKGVRFVRTSEPDKGAKLGEALIKLVTGGEPFPARELNKPFFMLHPQFKLTISGNYRPKITGTDEGIWRRLMLVPWTVTIAKDRVDASLPHKLADESSGIFLRMVEGLRDWLQSGLITPEEVNTATAEYRSDSDPLGRFLEACVQPSTGDKEQSSVLHKVFCAWCKANGEREWTPIGFGMAMSDRGYHSKKSNVSWWLDIKLTKGEGDFVDGEGRALVKDKAGDGGGASEKTDDLDDDVPF